MSRCIPIAILAFLAMTLLTVPDAFGATRHTADFPTLLVTFQTTKTVTVTLSDLSPVGTSSGPPTTISPGTYNISIDDAAFVSDVQWHLSGPGVNLVTNMSYGEEPSESWVETFLPSSTYTYRDDNRPGTVFTFQTTATALVGTQGNGQAPLTSTTPQASSKNGKASSTDVVGSARATVRGTILGTVSPAGKLTLTSGGKTVSTLKAGLYKLTVTDNSKKAGFSVQQTKKSATTVTTGSFTGKKTATISLKAGQWFAYPSFVSKKLYFFVVAA